MFRGNKYYNYELQLYVIHKSNIRARACAPDIFLTPDARARVLWKRRV